MYSLHEFIEGFVVLNPKEELYPDILQDYIDEIIVSINNRLKASDLYTFGIIGAKGGNEVIFDIYEISSDIYGDIDKRIMISTFFWRQKVDLQKKIQSMLSNSDWAYSAN